jgi:hypothetical protein
VELAGDCIDPSTAVLLRYREAKSSLRMTKHQESFFNDLCWELFLACPEPKGEGADR